MSLLKLNSKFCKLATEQRLYGLEIPIIGLTGGIATGKSTVSGILKQKGLPVIDADALVKDIYAKESTKALVSRVAPTTLGVAGIDFKALRQIFFEDNSVKSELEKHIYSLLPEAFRSKLHEQKNPKYVVYDVPLLFEKSLQEKMDVSVLVYAPRHLQTKRMIERDEIDEQLAQKILNNQMDIEEKRKFADFILENSSDFSSLNKEVTLLLKKLFV